MKKFEINIAGSSYPIAFKYGAIRCLGSYLEKESYDETVAEVAVLLAHMIEVEKKKKASIPFKMTDSIGYIIMAGVYGGGSEVELELDDVIQAMLEDIELVQKVFECFFEWQPKPKKADPAKGKKMGPRKAPTKAQG